VLAALLVLLARLVGVVGLESRLGVGNRKGMPCGKGVGMRYTDSCMALQ
jgi:hypothetical protein